jgi:hypothetical protein
MKKIIIFILGFVLLGVSLQAQILKPVKWSFTAAQVKGKAGMYEVHVTALIDKGWKTYSQSTPADGPSPTVIKFKPNPMVLLGGKVKEIGELHKIDEPAFGVQVFYYTGKVDFVQVVKIKALSPRKGDLSQKERIVLQGTVEFMVCDASQCLPPDEVGFTVELK